MLGKLFRKYYDTFYHNKTKNSLISNVRIGLNIVCFLMGNSPAFEVYMPTFRTMFHLHRQVVVPLKMEQTVLRNVSR